MSSKLTASVLVAVGLLAGCARSGSGGMSPANMNTAAREAVMSNDHSALADAYEQAAQAAADKATEEQRMRDHYQEHRYLYGKQSLSLQAQYDALIDHYKQLAKADRDMARLHRQIAESKPGS